MKEMRIALALAILLIGLMLPTQGFTVTLGTGVADRAVGSTANFALDDSSRLREESILSEGDLFQVRDLTGSGRNVVDQSISSNGRGAKNRIDSSGSVQASTTVGASDSGIGLSQDLAGHGDIATTVSASTGDDASSQQSEVASGALSTSQTLFAAEGAYTGQSTDLKGEAAAIVAVSSSEDNDMSLSAGFAGDGNLHARIDSLADETSVMGGDASIMGVPVLEDEYIDEVASGEIGMSLEGLYAQPNGDLGTFGMSMGNTKKGGSGSSTSSLLTGPELTSDGGRSSAYVLTGYRWNTRDPQLKLNLKTDSNLAGEGLSTSAVQGAIAAAANTWDDATNQNLFADSGLVTLSSTVATDKRDYKNTLAWKYLSDAPSALAYSRTWYSYTKVGGYKTAVESDISFNTRYSWSTSGSSNYDVQTVALHELGHSIGLGDLYGLSQFSSDTRQIMHYYTGVKRTLGNGDKTGVWTLYG